MKIYTGNFANVKKYKEKAIHPISIAISARYFSGDKYIPLNPHKSFMMESEETYTPKYKEILSKLDVEQVVNDLKKISNNKNIVLLCHEKEGDFCHRHLVAKWLEESIGINIVELGKMKNENIQKTLF